MAWVNSPNQEGHSLDHQITGYESFLEHFEIKDLSFIQTEPNPADT